MDESHRHVNGTLANIGLIVVFVLIGSMFAAAEIALVSLREGQVRAMAHRGRRGEAVARLAKDPNRFLAAVQVGVTLAGFLSASFGGATLAGELSPKLVAFGVPAGRGRTSSRWSLVTVAISYLSLVLGELAPKRLALQRAEGFALALGPTRRPDRQDLPAGDLAAVGLHQRVVRLVGGDPNAKREQMSDEELRELVNTHETLGEEERRIVEDVFEAGDRQIREVMIPRTEVDFLDAGTPVFRAAKEALHQPHSRYPVIRGSADDVIGFVHVRDLLDPEMAGRSMRVGELARQILVLPWTRPMLAALADMRREGHAPRDRRRRVRRHRRHRHPGGPRRGAHRRHQGRVRRRRGRDHRAPRGRRRGRRPAQPRRLRGRDRPRAPEGPYETVSGFLMARLGRLPQVDDWVDYAERRLRVREIEGRRVGRVLVTAVPALVVVDPDQPVTIEVEPPEQPLDQPDDQPDASRTPSRTDGRPTDQRAGQTTVPTT